MKPEFSVGVLAALAALAVLASPAHADLYVIVNPATAISAGDIKDIFIGQKQFADGVKLMPVDNAAAQEAFLAKALRMEPGRYNTIWTKKSFREGLTPPYVKTGDTDVVEYVRKTVGAVGYVSAPPPASVTIVNVIHEF